MTETKIHGQINNWPYLTELFQVKSVAPVFHLFKNNIEAT